MNTTWVLVANASEARLFSAAKIGEEMECIKEFNHPESRERGSTLASDRPGHNKGKGGGHGAMGDPADPKIYEAERFAGELAKELEKGRASNAYKRLVVVASPRFRGLLNSQMKDNTRALLIDSIDKDLTSCHERDLPTRLKEYVRK
jgi:protein required for attachment to host cells